MTLSTTTAKISHAGNGATTIFAFPYTFLSNSDLVVVLRTIATGTESIKTLGVDYTVTGAAVPGGGNVAFGSAPGAGETVVIYRDPAATQETDLQTNGAFAAETVEQALDRITMAIQALRLRLARAPQWPVTYTGADPVLPEPVANMLLAWNALGTALENKALASVTSQAVSSFMLTLLDDADAATARATLGITASTQNRVVDAQTGASYAVVTGDGAKIKKRTHSADMSDTIPQAISPNFPNGFFLVYWNAATDKVITLTPTTSTINGAANLKIQPGQWVCIVSDGTNWQADPQPLVTGVQYEPLPANSWIPRTTNGPAGPTKVEATTNKNNYEVLDFDGATQEFADKDFYLPPGYDGATAIKARFAWTSAGGTPGQGVRWGIQGRWLGDDDAIDQAYGTAGEVTDTLLATGDEHLSAEATFTPAGTWAAGKRLALRVYRAPADAGDTMSGADARLRDVLLGLTYLKGNDA